MAPHSSLFAVLTRPARLLWSMHGLPLRPLKRAPWTSNQNAPLGPQFAVLSGRTGGLVGLVRPPRKKFWWQRRAIRAEFPNDYA
jgi:hypothetical protein